MDIVSWVGTVSPTRSRIDVFDERGAGLGAIGTPEFIALAEDVGGKVQVIAHGGEIFWGRGRVRADVFDQGGRRAIGAPELITVGVVVALEVEIPVDGNAVRKIHRVGIV